MFNWISKTKPEKKPLPVIDSFEAAGVIFTNRHFVLAGWQPRKSMPKMSGIGGMRNGSEPYVVTALRELVEELYGCAEVPIALIHKLMTKFEPIAVFKNDHYVNVIYSFEDLEGMLAAINKAGIKTYFYEKPPQTLVDLIFKRKKSAVAEVESLTILPLDLFKNGCIDPDFQMDVSILIRTLGVEIE